MIYAEFIGIPGAGKTTIRDRMIKIIIKKTKINPSYEYKINQILKKNNYDRLWKIIFKLIPNKIADKIRSFIFNRSQIKEKSFLKYISQNRKIIDIIINKKNIDILDLDKKLLIMKRMCDTISIYQAINEYAGQNDLIVYDELFYQKVLSFFVRIDKNEINKKHDEIYRYLDEVPAPDFIIYVKTDIKKCLNRIKNRKKSHERIKDQDANTIYRFLEKCEVCIDMILKWAKQNKITVIEINNNKYGCDLHDSVGKITEYMA